MSGHQAFLQENILSHHQAFIQEYDDPNSVSKLDKRQQNSML